MATEVVMPQMGYDMTEGTVVKWVKHEGDEVKKGDIIAEIETTRRPSRWRRTPLVCFVESPSARG